VKCRNCGKGDCPLFRRKCDLLGTLLLELADNRNHLVVHLAV
jgi:hypothetical protein